jgi:hypothetical protein
VRFVNQLKKHILSDVSLPPPECLYHRLRRGRLINWTKSVSRARIITHGRQLLLYNAKKYTVLYNPVRSWYTRIHTPSRLNNAMYTGQSEASLTGYRCCRFQVVNSMPASPSVVCYGLSNARLHLPVLSATGCQELACTFQHCQLRVVKSLPAPVLSVTGCQKLVHNFIWIYLAQRLKEKLAMDLAHRTRNWWM